MRELEEVLNIKIDPCGLTIDTEFSFLGASPDGKRNLGIVEIKCPSSAVGLEPDKPIKQKKNPFWQHGNHQFVVNKSHIINIKSKANFT